MQSAARSYFQTKVTTTTQGDLVILLFDAALKFLHQAKEKMAEKDYAQKGILISKALDILSELQGSLNAQKGGELADRLQKLYFFCSSRLLAANLKMNVSMVDEVVHILSGLRDAFSQANAQVATKPVPVSVAQSAPHAPAAQAPAAPIVLPRPRVQASYAAAARAAAPAPAQAHATPQETAPEVPEQAPAFPAEASTPTVQPVRRIMAAYAASRIQG